VQTLSLTQCASARRIRRAAARTVHVEVCSSPSTCTLSLTLYCSETLLDIRLLPLVATVLSCAGLAVSTLYSPSRSSRSQHPAHLDALRAQEPAARAIARWKLVKALAAAALLALSVYTELAFAGGKSALVRVALVCPAVRLHAPAPRLY
jgi:hypothetical protein